MLKAAAVIVTYNRKELLLECLDAIFRQTYPVETVLVIDNNSTDGTYERLEEAGLLQRIQYRKLETNTGGAGGFHAGFRESLKYDYDRLWIMDDDTIPEPDCLENLVSALETIKDEKVSFVASCIYGPNAEFMNVPRISKARSENGYPNWYKHLADGMMSIATATFVSLLISRDAIENVGFPVKDYFIWGDDTEYTLRLIKYYGPAYLVGKSVAIHKRKSAQKLNIVTDEAERLDFYFYFFRNYLINTSTYEGKKPVIREIISNYRTMITILLSPNVKNRLKKISIIHRGTWAFLLKKYDVKAFENRLNGAKNVK